MNLSERDECDLAGLASNLGNPEAHVRARLLLETNTDAVEYYRQVRLVRDALEVQSDVVWPLLPSTEADALAATILRRSKRRRSLRNKLFRHPRRWGSVAAAVLIVAAGLAMYLGYERSLVASATYIPVGAHLTIRGADKRFDVPIKAGQRVEGVDGYTVLSLRNGGRVAMQALTNLTVRAGGREIDLETGSMFIQTTAPMHIQAGSAGISLDEPNAKAIIEISPTTVRCLVQSGRAKVIVAGHETVLAEGQMGSLDLASGKLRVQPLDNRGSGWIGEAFKEATRNS